MNGEYWKKRFEAIEAMNHQRSEEVIKQDVIPAFDSASRHIQKELESWYQRFADNNGISMAEAKKMLTTKELKELKWDVDEYIKAGKQNAVDQSFMKELENASARYHISRLESLQMRTQMEIEKAYGNYTDAIDEHLASIYTSDYYHTAFEIQKGFGVGFNIGQVDEKKLDKIIHKPWTADENTFSDRIWNQKQQLINNLHTGMTQMCILGEDPEKMINQIEKQFGVSKSQAGRLIMTESAHMSSEAHSEAYKDLDVEECEVVATLDSVTSEICREMDGTIFKLSEREEGVNCPPFHPWCRSTYVPYYKDDYGVVGERIARGADGKTYKIPANMKYKDWEDNFVTGKKDPSKWGLKSVKTSSKADQIKQEKSDLKKESEDLKKEKNDIIDENHQLISDISKQSSRKNEYLKGLQDFEEFIQKGIDPDTLVDVTEKRLEVIPDERKEIRRLRRNLDSDASDYEEMWEKYTKQMQDLDEENELLYERLQKAVDYRSWNSKFKDVSGAEYFDEEIERMTSRRTALKNRVHEIDSRLNAIHYRLQDIEELIKTDKELYDELFTSHIRQQMIDSGVEYREVKRFDKQPTMEEIIERLGGGDETEGSCASLGLAYAGNRNGLDVLDFRDGLSRQTISYHTSSMEVAKLNGVRSIVEEGYNQQAIGKKILKNVVVGKEYYFTNGCHASIVRKNSEGVLEYLELQASGKGGYKNGWHSFIDPYDRGYETNTIEGTLQWRFASKKSKTYYGTKVKSDTILIDIDSLKDNSEFEKILGYINTAESAQRKSMYGTIK